MITLIKDNNYESTSIELSALKIFLRDCSRKNIIDPIDTSDFKVYQEEVENIYLTEDEINSIFYLDLSANIEQERIRDLFIT